MGSLNKLIQPIVKTITQDLVQNIVAKETSTVTPAFARITQDGNTRLTQDGTLRITQGA